MIRSASRSVALPAVAVEQAADPSPHTRLVDQPEKRQEGHREDERDRTEGGDPDSGQSARRPAESACYLAGVRLQDVKRIAWPVDQAAEVAVARLVNQARQGLAEVPESVDDGLQQNSDEDEAEDGYPQHQHRCAQRPAPRQPTLHRLDHRRKDRDAEHRDEEQQQDVADRSERKGDGDDRSDDQDGPNRDRDHDFATICICGCRARVRPAHLGGHSSQLARTRVRRGRPPTWSRTSGQRGRPPGSRLPPRLRASGVRLW